MVKLKVELAAALPAVVFEAALERGASHDLDTVARTLTIELEDFSLLANDPNLRNEFLPVMRFPYMCVLVSARKMCETTVLGENCLSDASPTEDA